MVAAWCRDDALLAFERHATSKLKNADDLLSIATLGFRGEALPSIASVSRLRLETRAAEEASGTVVEIAGGKILTVEEAGLPPGTSITVRDLFFNTPARKKFLKAESTELSHIASLVTHYALAHPDKHWELHSATNAMLIAAPVPITASASTRSSARRRSTSFFRRRDDASSSALACRSLHRGEAATKSEEPPAPGEVRVHGFVSQARDPEAQSQFHLHLRQWAPHSRPPRPCTHSPRPIATSCRRRSIPVVLLFLEMPFTRGRRQRASVEDRGPLPPAVTRA